MTEKTPDEFRGRTDAGKPTGTDPDTTGTAMTREQQGESEEFTSGAGTHTGEGRFSGESENEEKSS